MTRKKMSSCKKVENYRLCLLDDCSFGMMYKLGSDEQSKIRIYPFFLFTHVALMRRMMMMTTLELGISFIIVFILEALHQTYNRTKSFNIHVSIPSSHADTKGCREREWEVGWVLSQLENQSKWIKEKRAKKCGNADAVLLSLFSQTQRHFMKYSEFIRELD